MKDKIQSFETFRGFAALMIAAVHFNVNSQLVTHPFANGVFVHFFFTLSGFVIYLNYFKKLDNFLSIKSFLIKRLKRLYPIHIFFVFIFLFIEIIKYYLQENYNIRSNNQPFTKNNLSSLFGNIFLLQTFFKYNSFNTVSWSISAEFFTYTSFALYLLIKKKFTSILYFLLALLIIRIFSNAPFGSSTTIFSFIDCIYCFTIGCMCCDLYTKISVTEWYNKNYNILSLIFLLGSGFAIINFKSSYYVFFTPIIFGFLLIFSAKLKSENFYAKFLTNSFFIYLGKISYSIYMSHLFIFFMITQILRFIFKHKTYVDINNGKILLELNAYEASFIVIVAYILTIIFSHFLYEKIEKRFYLFNIK